jgi:hypothetical protein
MMRDPIVASTQYGWHDTHYPVPWLQAPASVVMWSSDPYV